MEKSISFNSVDKTNTIELGELGAVWKAVALFFFKKKIKDTFYKNKIKIE